MRVLANGQLLHKQTVDHEGERWKPVDIDLSQFAGKKITLRLENCANDWNYEFGYWSDLRIVSDKEKIAARVQ